MARWERTRQLIELGGLVRKAGLLDLLDDDRAALDGALLEVAGMLGTDRASSLREAFRRHFEAESARLS